MSNPLDEYLSALEARDAREKAHEAYINAYTKLADRTAALANQTAAEDPITASSGSTKTLTPKGKGPATSDTPSPSTLAQLRTELAATQRTRGDLETQVSTLTTELSALKTSDAQQRQRIDQLEKAKAALERRSKDRVDELKGKGKFVEEIQDEMVALNLQLNMAEQEKEKLRKDNEELTKRWVQRMEEEARKMNERSGWGDQSARRKK
ncbi:autophagy protein 16 [Decorospora gaudefroyi]|uniref:Autophagy protein 16 n=1 Tax=Decorospora gaudefroyi TaxID=184978 RepID=A0A6A5KPQ5_9PLEO|nr:autophagy protein 16 [Decorospora gaudefroyi]